MTVDSFKNGVVIDHITAGRGMEIYELLGLGSSDATVAIMKNVPSTKMGRKDIIKIDGDMAINLAVLGYIDPGITVNIIRDGALAKRERLTLPDRITDVIRCKNPRCITSTEQELAHVFKLTDRENRVYRCIYCETKGETKRT